MVKHSDDGVPVGVFSPAASVEKVASGSTRGRRASGWIAALALGLCMLGAPTSASATDEYDPQQAGHPLRIAAYVVHPVGVMLDYLFLRPAYWVGSHEPFRTLFGRSD